ncbi:MAG: hypothetical protein QCI00_07470, partial [Candidatus Thermoplasmatota archaeon]|nr:hypothetical protein [Candidatus Thermoplasmatota archaeon]
MDLRNELKINTKNVTQVNEFLMDSNNDLINAFLTIVEKYGSPEEINKKAKNARKIDNLIGRLQKRNSPYVNDLNWLIDQKENNAFISIDEYRKKILGDKAKSIPFNSDYAVTLEISACQYFSFFMEEARQAVKNK